MFSARCSACKLSGQDLPLGIGMSRIFSFLRNHIGYCTKCKKLTTMLRVYSPATLVRFVNDPHLQRHDKEGLIDLLQTLALAVAGTCETCNEPAKLVRASEHGRASKCP
ncbi:MAG TPA: hypothetical protein VHO25_01220, partial [Polyangiaceae bacterium]|nr:hypothetical protein [Polyangiaceae bacterium]